MYKYAQLNEENICIGVQGATSELTIEGLILIDTFDVDLIGKVYVDGMFIDPPSSEVAEPSVYKTQNEAITSGESPLQGLNNTYYAPVETEVKLTTEIVDEQGQLQSQLDQTELGYPPVLKMPVVKFAGGINGAIIDEVYFTVTLVEGVLTATGKLPSSGDWKLLTNRLNQSLQAIGADWKIERANTTFLV